MSAFSQMPVVDQLRWFCFSLLHGINTDWFSYVNHPCISGINPLWGWCTVLLRYFWVWVASVFLTGFASVLIRDIHLWFCFFLMSFSSFGIGVLLGSENELGNVPSSCIFWMNLRKTGVNFLNVCQTSPVKPSGLELYWVQLFSH